MLIESLPTHDDALHEIRLRFSAEGLHVSRILYVVICILAGLAGALFRGVMTSYILGGGHALLIGASGAISVVLGIESAAGNTRAYYWLILQIMFTVFSSFASIPIPFTAHNGGFFAGVFFTKLFVEIERKKRAKYSRPSGNNTYDTWRGE
ncbi:MAG: hypothetical protein WCF23_07845 [Candidatus Nitrosopolaris sp.]